jgi:multidrug efflux pump
MEENNKMKNEPVNKLMLQMGVPMVRQFGAVDLVR